MFCNNCHKSLEDFAVLLDKMERCPFCGEILMKEPKEIPQESFESYCNNLVEANGHGIFATEESLFQAIASAATNFEDARDKMSLLTIKQIPSKLYAAKDFPEEEIAQIVNKCQKQLVINLGVSFDVCKEMLLALQKVIFGKVIPVPAYFVGDYFVDPRDGNKYKTVKIGDQIWMAENLRYEVKGVFIYDNDYSKWAKYGYLYPDNITSVAPDGWRVPKEDDFKKLFSFVGRTSQRKDWHKCLLAKDDAWNNNDATDDFGFAALPGGYFSTTCSGSFHDFGKIAAFKCDGNLSYSISQDACCTAYYTHTSIRLIKDESKK